VLTLRVLLAGLPLLLVPAGFSALVLLDLTEDPGTQFALLGFAFACGVATVVCWWMLALARLATAR